MYQEVLKISGVSTPWRCVQFDGVSEFVAPKEPDNCKEILRNSVEPYLNGASGHSISSWLGCKDKKEFNEIINNGHKKYVDMIYEKQLSVTPPKSLRRKKIKADFGDELDIHQVLNGDLMHAWSSRSPKIRVSSKYIHIVINGSVNCSHSAEQVQWIGVAALRCAETFEQAGYNVAIDMTYSSKLPCSEENITLMVPVKSYDQPMDIQQLSSCICFPGFFRGPGFMNYGFAKGDVQGGLGKVPTDGELEKIMPKFYNNPAEKIEIVSNQAISREAAQSECQRILSKYGYQDQQAA